MIFSIVKEFFLKNRHQRLLFSAKTIIFTHVVIAGMKCCGPVSRVLALTGQRTGS
jgi:hypothetical protein